MAKDYYKTLGVERNATQDEIKKAFRALAHKYHPDKGGDAEKFKEVNEAYQALGDSEKRSRYDRFGSAGFESAGGPNPFGGFSGFEGFSGFGQGQGIDVEDLGDIFGNVFGFGSGRSRQERRGADIEMDLRLTFEEAARGGRRVFELYKTVQCDHCGGSGGEPGSEVNTCKNCNGAGQVTRSQRTIFGVMRMQETCPDCRGEGKTVSKRCSRCSGSGLRKEAREIAIDVPPGIDNGETLRLAGEGEAAKAGARSGDLYIRVRVKSDPRFERSGDDLLIKKNIGFSLAALGGEIRIETLDGKVAVDIPAGIQSGQVLRLRGQGLVSRRRSGRGDLLVQVTVTTPKKLSREQKRLFEELKLE